MSSNKSIKDQKKHVMLKSILGGAQVGLGSIIPGVSGAVMAVSLGLYRPMIDALAGLVSDFKKNFRFLLPIGIGVVFGLLCGAVLLDWLLVRFLVPLLYLFIGLIAGGIPAFIREANEKGFNKGFLLAALGGAILASGLLLLEQFGSTATNIADGLSIFQALIAGVIIAAGAIIPGISTSFILIYLGWYAAVIDVFSQPDFTIIIFIVLGIIICAASIIKLVRWLFDRFHGYAYYCVLGFLIVSIVLIWPPLTDGLTQMLSMLLIIPGFILAFLYSRKASTKK